MENAYTKGPVIPFWQCLGRYITLIKLEMGYASTQRSWDLHETTLCRDPGILQTPLHAEIQLEDTVQV